MLREVSINIIVPLRDPHTLLLRPQTRGALLRLRGTTILNLGLSRLPDASISAGMCAASYIAG